MLCFIPVLVQLVVKFYLPVPIAFLHFIILYMTLDPENHVMWMDFRSIHYITLHNPLRSWIELGGQFAYQSVEKLKAITMVPFYALYSIFQFDRKILDEKR